MSTTTTSDTWDLPDAPNVAATSAALGGPSAPGPIGDSASTVLSRLRTEQKPISLAPHARPSVQNPSAPPKDSENNVVDPTQSPMPWDKAPEGLRGNMAQALHTIHGGESSGGDDLTLQNIDPSTGRANSSASGPFQIEKPTFVGAARNNFPELQGKSDNEIWALRADRAWYDKVKNATMWDNAQALSRNKVPPTAPNLVLAWRAGADGAVKLINADPNAVAGDIVPDLRGPGNGGAGNLTVGQLRMNPYARGPGGDNPSPLTLSALTTGQQLLSQEREDFAKGKAKVAQLEHDYKPVDVPPLPKPPDTDPLKTFSSLAGVFATLAAGFSRTPAIAAMNGLAGAMDAAKKNDWEGYKANYDQYKTQSDLAIKTQEMHGANIERALREMTTNMSAGHTMLESALTLANDEENLKHLHNGDLIAIGQRNDKINETNRQLAEEKGVTDASAELTAANHGLSAAQASGDPEQIKAWEKIVQDKRAVLDRESSQLREVRQAQKGVSPWGSGAAGLKNQANIARATKVFNDREGRAPDMNDPNDQAKMGEIAAALEAADVGAKESAKTAAKPLSVSAQKAADENTLAATNFTEKFGRPPDERANANDAKEMAKLRADQRTGGGEVALSDDAIDMNARLFLLTRQMPSLGLGNKGNIASARIKIQNRAAELAQEQGLSVGAVMAGQAEYKADQGSLAQLTKMSDAAISYENTALANMKTADSLMQAGQGTPLGPVVNRWLQAGKKATGDADVKALDVAIYTFAEEYAKVMSGATGAQAATDTARTAAHEKINIADSPQAIQAVMSVMRRDMENRKTELLAQREAIKTRIGTIPGMGGQPGASSAPATSSAPTATQGPKENDTGKSKSGKDIIFRNGNWEYQNAGTP